MFHPDIIARRVSILERQFGVRLYEYSVDDSRHVSEIQLENKRNTRTGKLEGLTEDEQLFIQNEILMSRASFPYWFERYPKLILDDATGELGHPALWESQRIMLKRLGERERDMFREYDAGHTRFDGNRWYVHKARQMGLSSICQGINVHGTNFYSNTNCLVGSTTLPKTQDLHRTYGRLMWDSQPDWMKVPATKDHGVEGMVFANGSKIILQHAEMESGFGQGAKWHRSHLTEIASWKETGARGSVTDHIDNHFDPAVSRSIKSCAFLESTSQGMDNYWHLNTERARAKRLGWWWYLFIPWWLVPNLYIMESMPDSWEPNEKTKEEEEKIVRNSPEFNDGRTYRPSRQQMYWWEHERNVKQEKGLLNEHYKNYPSIPEDSFTHSGRSSFDVPTIEWISTQIREPYAYYDWRENVSINCIRDEREKDALTGEMVDPPAQYTIDGCGTLVPIRVTDEERLNPLGLVLAWEPPKVCRPSDLYGSVDTTGGIEGWNRFFRRKGDEDINNACISFIRSGLTHDVDVLEFAAPITPKPLARLYNMLARTWLGRNEMDGQTPTIVELTGEGLAFQEELIAAYNFFAFYQHFDFNGGEWIETNKFGWTPTAKSVRHLWSLFKSHVTDRNYIPRSRHLLREMRSCTDDEIYVAGMTRGKGPKRGGRHDDRVYSRAFAIWYANSWANPEPKAARDQSPRVTVEGSRKPKLHEMDFGFSDPDVREQFMDSWESEGLDSGQPSDAVVKARVAKATRSGVIYTPNRGYQNR